MKEKTPEEDNSIFVVNNTGDVVNNSQRYKNLHVGVNNGRRWIALKKRLGLDTDDDLFTHLLDLADSIAG